MTHGKQEINLRIFLMINILFTKSKNFQKQLYSYLDSRKPNDPSKLKVVKRIIFDVKKKQRPISIKV